MKIFLKKFCEFPPCSLLLGFSFSLRQPKYDSFYAYVTALHFVVEVITMVTLPYLKNIRYCSKGIIKWGVSNRNELKNQSLLYVDLFTISLTIFTTENNLLTLTLFLISSTVYLLFATNSSSIARLRTLPGTGSTRSGKRLKIWRCKSDSYPMRSRPWFESKQSKFLF